MADIKDFGEKIGGARKDIWASRGLLQTDLDVMNEMERQKHVKKDNVWLKPNWEQLISEGTPQCVACWQNKMRQSLPPRPPQDNEETQNNYIAVVSQIRDAVMAVKDPYEIDNFYKNILRPAFVDPESRGYYVSILPVASGIVTSKVLKAAQSNHWEMEKEAKKKLFGIPKDEKTYTAVKNTLSIYKYDGESVFVAPDTYTKDRNRLTIKSSWGQSYYYMSPKDKFYHPEDWKKGSYFVVNDNSRKPIAINFESQSEAKEFVETFARDAQALAKKREEEMKAQGDEPNRKRAFVPPQLSRLHRTGPKYRGIRSADGDMFLNDLKFRAGEFGNWLNNNDRQASLNMAYDAFRDLARVLQINPEDVALNNTLAIAFGARGRGGANAAAAHYEPDRQVINLTKMSGAGCLAHEWGHAFDHAIGRFFGSTGLASEMKSKKDLPDSFKDLLTSLRYKKVIVQPSELSTDRTEQVEKCKKNLSNWIASVRPSKMPDDLAKKWEDVSKSILEGAALITGVEYVQLGGRRGTVVTNPEIEMLSQIRKHVTRHSIPKDTKRQIVMWATSLQSAEQQLQSQEPSERRVKTDFYKGSAEFDRVFSKHAHGYWQSECEMFARAFDCYVFDKIKESGHQSQFLTAYANSFLMPGTNGETIYAVPMGEERKLINEKFDCLIADMKQRGMLHEFIEPLETEKPKESRVDPSLEAQDKPAPEAFSKPKRYQQMSLDDLLFADEPAHSEATPKQPNKTDYER